MQVAVIVAKDSFGDHRRSTMPSSVTQAVPVALARHHDLPDGASCVCHPSFGVMSTSPRRRTASRAVPWSRSPRGFDPDTALDEYLVDRHAVHLHVVSDYSPLHIEALALVGLLDGADPSLGAQSRRLLDSSLRTSIMQVCTPACVHV